MSLPNPQDVPLTSLPERSLGAELLFFNRSRYQDSAYLPATTDLPLVLSGSCATEAFEESQADDVARANKGAEEDAQAQIVKGDEFVKAMTSVGLRKGLSPGKSTSLPAVLLLPEDAARKARECDG